MASKTQQNGALLNLLKQLGLNQYESRIYSSLLSMGALTAGELAEVSNVPRSRVYDVLTSLEKKGFALPQIGKPIKYLGLPVESAVSTVKSTLEDDYQKRVDFVTKLEKNLRSALEEHLSSSKKTADIQADFVGMLKGKSNVYGHIKHMISNSSKRIIKITDEEGLSNLEKHCKSAFEKAKKKGIKTKILANAPNAKSSCKLSDYAHIKTHTGINGKILVKDGEEVVFMSGNDDSGVWIKSPHIAGALEKLFDHAWEKGKSICE